MSKRLLLITIIIVLMVTAGCDQLTTNSSQTQDGTVNLSESDYATLAAAITPTTENTSDGILRLPTPTATDLFGVSGGNAEAESTKSPASSGSTSATAAPGSITITGIQETAPGRAVVNWAVTGNFPSGFKVVWSEVQGKPTYPEDKSVYASSYTARSAQITGEAGKIYYVRVCRYINDSCDIYSDLGIFALIDLSPTAISTAEMTQTKLAIIPTKTPVKSSSSSSGTVKTSTSTSVNIDISSIVTWSDGKAKITWTASGTSSYGFKIVYSTSSTTPTYGTHSYYAITDSTAREAYVDGTPGTTYYYRICRFTGSACDNYSDTYTFTYSGTAYTATPTATTDAASIIITNIEDVAVGQVRLTWTASYSDFSNGFKILYSSTNNPPTTSDNVIGVSSGTSPYTYVVTGTDATKYYFRICKYNGSSCTIYSPVVEHTFAADPAEISITSITYKGSGVATVKWSASGFFATNGFKILYSSVETSPAYGETGVSTTNVSGYDKATTYENDHSFLMPNTKIYYRICESTGSDCDVYSDTYTFTYDVGSGNSLITPNVALDGSNNATVSWTLDGSYTLPSGATGYAVFWIPESSTPTWTQPYSAIIGDTGTLSTVLSPAVDAGNYSFRVCVWNGSYCLDYSPALSVSVPALP